MQVAQEAAQRRDGLLAAGRAKTVSQAKDELVGIPRRVPLQPAWTLAEALGDEGTSNRQLAVNRGSAETALVDEESFVSAHDPIHRTVVTGTGRCVKSAAALSQVGQQLAAGRCLSMTRADPQVASLQEGFAIPPVKRCDVKTLMLDRGTEIADGCKLQSGEVAGVDLCRKLVCESTEMQSQQARANAQTAS